MGDPCADCYKLVKRPSKALKIAIIAKPVHLRPKDCSATFSETVIIKSGGGGVCAA